MLDKIGEEFSGIISAVTSFGFFVELADIYVEGLVHISNLGQDYFHFDPTSHQLKGERSGINYRLGDQVVIKVARVDLDEKKMDFELIQKVGSARNIPTAKPSKKAKSSKGAKGPKIDKPAKIEPALEPVAKAADKTKKRRRKKKKPTNEIK